MGAGDGLLVALLARGRRRKVFKPCDLPSPVGERVAPERGSGEGLVLDAVDSRPSSVMIRMTPSPGREKDVWRVWD
jgi:hypothetical protein